MELNDRLRQKVTAYKPSPEDLISIKSAPLLLLAGTTGAGKDAVIDQLLATYPNQYQYILSHITRPMRPYEKDGVHYHFIDFKTAENLLESRGYIEANIVHADHIYGTTISEVKRIYDAGKIATSDITIEGCDDYVRLGLNAKIVFLLPPNYQVWKERFNRRNDAIGTAELKNRLQSAVREINHALNTPYFYIVINDKLDDTAELVNQIAHGEPVEPHYHKAMDIGKDLLQHIQAELSTLDA